MNSKLSTPRLELRPIRIEDVQLAHSLWTITHVRRFLFDDRMILLDEAHSLVEDSLDNFEQYGYGLWLVVSRETAMPIGFAGFLSSTSEGPNLVYGIHPDFCGNGFATEAAKAVLAFAFGMPVLSCVKADVDEPNVASVRILEKLGMRQIRRAIVAGRPLLYYEQRRDSK